MGKDWGNIGIDPVIIAILAAVFHNPQPRAPAFESIPKVLINRFRHVGMPHDIVRLALQLFTGELRYLYKGGVDAFNHAFEIGGADQAGTFRYWLFNIGNW